MYFCYLDSHSHFDLLGMILTDKRGNLTPTFFEDLLILHMNVWQCDDDDDHESLKDNNNNNNQQRTI